MSTVILVIGDTHIPDRADTVPDKLREVIEEGKPWSIVVFTGDFTGKTVYDWVYGLGRKVYVVRGNMDYLPLPKTARFSIGDIVFGVHHGDGVYPRGDTRGLTRIASRLNVKVLFNGHTHDPFVKTSLDGRILFINPGSLTGVWSGGGGSLKPSMMIVEVLDNNLKTIHYELSRDWRRLSVYEKKAVLSSDKWIV